MNKRVKEKAGLLRSNSLTPAFRAFSPTFVYAVLCANLQKVPHMRFAFSWSLCGSTHCTERGRVFPFSLECDSTQAFKFVARDGIEPQPPAFFRAA